MKASSACASSSIGAAHKLWFHLSQACHQSCCLEATLSCARLWQRDFAAFWLRRAGLEPLNLLPRLLIVNCWGCSLPQRKKTIQYPHCNYCLEVCLPVKHSTFAARAICCCSRSEYSKLMLAICFHAPTVVGLSSKPVQMTSSKPASNIVVLHTFYYCSEKELLHPSVGQPSLTVSACEAHEV